MRLQMSLAALFSLVVIPAAHAQQNQTWDFTDPSTSVQQQSLTHVTRESDGLHIQTNTDGYLFWLNPFTQPVDVITFDVLSNKKSAEAGLIWHPPNTPPGASTQLNFQIPALTTPQEIQVVPTDNGYWDWHTDDFGIGFPAGTDIVIRSITLKRYDTWEKLSEAWQSFWTFDQFRPYSINFLWGPLLVFNPASRAQLFDSLPPHGWSADRLFYLIIGASLIVGIGWVILLRSKRSALQTAAAMVAGTIAVVWIAFDLRMGAEILSYAFHDVRSYVAAPANEKTFRTHGNFYTVADEMLPTIEKAARYVVVEPDQSPYYTNLRYMSYPSIPMHATQDTSKAALWVVINRPDVHIDAQNRLEDTKDKALSPPGHLLRTFDSGTFLFAVP